VGGRREWQKSVSPKGKCRPNCTSGNAAKCFRAGPPLLHFRPLFCPPDTRLSRWPKSLGQRLLESKLESKLLLRAATLWEPLASSALESPFVWKQMPADKLKEETGPACRSLSLGDNFGPPMCRWPLSSWDEFFQNCNSKPKQMEPDRKESRKQSVSTSRSVLGTSFVVFRTERAEMGASGGQFGTRGGLVAQTVARKGQTNKLELGTKQAACSSWPLVLLCPHLCSLQRA